MASIQGYKTLRGKRYRVRYRNARSGSRSKSGFQTFESAKRFRIEIERRKIEGELYEEASITFGEFTFGAEAGEEGLGEHKSGSRVGPKQLAPAREESGALGGGVVRTSLSESSRGQHISWESRMSQRWRRSSYERFCRTKLHLRYYNELSICKITVSIVEDHVNSIAETAPRQAQMVLSYLKQILRDAERRGQKVERKVLDIKPPRTYPKEPMILSVAQVRHLADEIPAPYGTMVELAAYTGMRWGELTALRWEDLDFETGTIAVRRSKTERGVRTVRFPKVLGREFWYGDGQTDTPSPMSLSSQLIFPSFAGQILHYPNFLQRIWMPACKRAGFEGFRFHWLRHTYISLMVSENVNPLVIAAQVGHTDASLIWKRYGHMYQDGVNAAAGAMERLLRDK